MKNSDCIMLNPVETTATNCAQNWLQQEKKGDQIFAYHDFTPALPFYKSAINVITRTNNGKLEAKINQLIKSLFLMHFRHKNNYTIWLLNHYLVIPFTDRVFWVLASLILSYWIYMFLHMTRSWEENHTNHLPVAASRESVKSSTHQLKPEWLEMLSIAISTCTF